METELDLPHWLPQLWSCTKTLREGDARRLYGAFCPNRTPPMKEADFMEIPTANRWRQSQCEIMQYFGE